LISVKAPFRAGDAAKIGKGSEYDKKLSKKRCLLSFPSDGDASRQE
jgi:hypothetical protein